MIITSSAFEHNGSIPRVYTCEGEDISPDLSWSNLPAGTQSLALIVDDPDAPDPAAPRMVYVHWVLYNLPPNLTGLNESVPRLAALADLGVQGINDFRKTAYDGPCPPAGKTHRYYFRLYALDIEPSLADGLTRQKLLDAMRGHILAQGEWMGTYQR